MATNEWMDWFQDLREQGTLDNGTINTDKSMLILKGIYAYLQNKAEAQKGKSALLEISKLFKHLA